MSTPTSSARDTAQSAADDKAILGVALGLEHQAIAAYRAAAGTGLLKGEALDMAVSFLHDHERHRDALTRLLTRRGGEAVAAKSAYDFGTITSAADILNLAVRLEQGALDAYLTHAAKLFDAGVLDEAAGILADEVRHTTALRLALSLPVTERPPY